MLKLVSEWCRIHIKTVLAQHYSLVVFYPILLWFTYAWFIQANPVQVGPGPPKAAQVNPNSQVRPGSPRKLVISCDFGVFGISWENLGVIFSDFVEFPGFPGRTWVLFSAILWSFRDFQVLLRFCGVSGISWENLGGNSWGWAWESCKS